MRYYAAILLWVATASCVITAYWRWGVSDNLGGAVAALAVGIVVGGAATTWTAFR